MVKFIGLLIGVVLGILGELIAAIIAKQSFFDQLISWQGLGILVVLVLLCLTVSTFLEKRDKSNRINVSGLNAERSAVTLKGPGITVKDTKLVDSPQDYNSLGK